MTKNISGTWEGTLTRTKPPGGLKDARIRVIFHDNGSMHEVHQSYVNVPGYGTLIVGAGLGVHKESSEPGTYEVSFAMDATYAPPLPHPHPVSGFLIADGTPAATNRITWKPKLCNGTLEGPWEGRFESPEGQPGPSVYGTMKLNRFEARL